MKAISAIIATIMLLMISVALIGVFYVFSSGIATTSTSAAGEQTSQITAQLSMCMKIDNIYKNQITLRNCGKGVIENKSLVVMMDDVKLNADTNTIQEDSSGTINITGLWQIPFGKHNLKISNGATFAQALVDVQPNKDGLVGSWNFNEGSGTMAGDGSGNGNAGTLINNPTWVGGKFGMGLQFDGSNDYVDISGVGNVLGNGVKNITVSMWFKGFVYGQGLIELGETAAWGVLDIAFDYDTPPYNGISLLMSGSELTYVGFSDSSNWHNLVATYDGTTRFIYLDGSLAAQGSYSIGLDFSGKASMIGGYYNYGAQKFNGAIDEVRIWNKSFFPDETVVMKQVI